MIILSSFSSFIIIGYGRQSHGAETHLKFYTSNPNIGSSGSFFYLGLSGRLKI